MKKDFGVDLDKNNGVAEMIDKFEFDGEVVEAWRERNHAQHKHSIKVVATDAMKADASSTGMCIFICKLASRPAIKLLMNYPSVLSSAILCNIQVKRFS